MPNYCDFEINVNGKPKNVKKLLEWICAKYNYGNSKPEIYSTNSEGNKVPTEHHIGYRIYECSYDKSWIEECEKEGSENITVYAFGYCAWSVKDCFLRDKYSYLSDYSIKEILSMTNKKISFIKTINILTHAIYEKYRHRKAISIDEACKKLNVNVEIYSRECGNCFAEHYYINNKGKIITKEMTQYRCIYIDDYKDYQEYIKDMRENYPHDKEALSITEEMYNKVDTSCIELCKWFLEGETNFDWQYVY